MKCRDIQERFSMYLNNDLPASENHLVEEHLKNCLECRNHLKQTERIRGKLTVIRETGAMSSITTGSILSKKATRRPSYLRPMAIAVPVILIVAAVISPLVSGIFDTPESIVAKAASVTENLRSFRSQNYEHYAAPEESSYTSYNMYILTEYAAPDRFHMTINTETIHPPRTYLPESVPAVQKEKYYNFFNELISIGSTLYMFQNSSFSPNADWLRNLIPTPEQSLELIDLLADIEELAEVDIDGERCYHYSGAVDMEKYRERQIPKIEKRYKRTKQDLYPHMDIETYIETQLAYIADEISLELWIGKSDSILRKEIITHSSGSYSEIRFFDFNDLIVIDPPLDESGQPAENWVAVPLDE